MSLREITLTKEQYTKLPYKGTHITRATTYGDIIGLLEGSGIKDYGFVKVDGVDVLGFSFTVEIGGLQRKIGVRLTVPQLYYYKQRGRYGPRTKLYLEKESWRVFWWYLKSKLEAVTYGIDDMVQIFASNIVLRLPDGSEAGVLGDRLLEAVSQDKLSRLANALEDHSSEGRRVIEVEAEERKTQ